MRDPYTDALKRVEANYGPAAEFGCIHCKNHASCWIVDNSAAAILDSRKRRYSERYTDYFPFCSRCAQSYENSPLDAPPVLFRRVNVFAERHWFSDCFTIAENASVLLRDAYATYLDFCREERVPHAEVMTRLTFKKALLRHGTAQKRTNTGAAIVGVKLR